MSSDETLTNEAPAAAVPEKSTNVEPGTPQAATSESTETPPASTGLDQSTTEESAGPETGAAEASTPEAQPAGETDNVADESASPSVESVQPSVPEAELTESASETAPADSTDSATASDSSADEKELESSSPRRVQLSPAAGDALKAVGTFETPAAPAESDSEDGDGEESADAQIEAAAAAVAEPVEEIEIPRDVDLDGDLAAEIEAAMATDTQIAEAAPADQSQQEMPERGTRVKGIVQSIHADDVFLDLGFRIPGIVQLRSFEGTDPPEIGQKIDVVIRKVDEAEGLIAVNLPRGKQKLGGNWDAVEVGQIVDCVVNKTNKGGLEVTVGGLRGFLPAGQVDLQYVESLDPFVGQKLQVQIIEVKPEKRNLVVSRRKLLIEERKEAEKTFWESVTENQEYQGRVKTIKDYGAFIDIGGVDGFLHIGQIAWTHIKHPSEVLTEGQEVTVKVIKIDREKNRISLGMKQMTENPWVRAADTYTPESTVTGTVTRTTDFGAFIELEPGIEGLAHISELDYKRVRKVEDVLKVGQEVNAQVLDFDGKRKRISLSLKALKEDPRKLEEDRLDREAEEAAKTLKTRQRDDLRGGIGGESSGGLFGNPSDFD